MHRTRLSGSDPFVLSLEHSRCVVQSVATSFCDAFIDSFRSMYRPVPSNQNFSQPTSCCNPSEPRFSNFYLSFHPYHPYTNERKLREVLRGGFGHGHRDKNLASLWRRRADTRLGRQRLQMSRNVRHDNEGVVSTQKVTSSCNSAARSHLLSPVQSRRLDHGGR